MNIDNLIGKVNKKLEGMTKKEKKAILVKAKLLNSKGVFNRKFFKKER